MSTQLGPFGKLFRAISKEFGVEVAWNNTNSKTRRRMVFYCRREVTVETMKLSAAECNHLLRMVTAQGLQLDPKAKNPVQFGSEIAFGAGARERIVLRVAVALPI